MEVWQIFPGWKLLKESSREKLKVQTDWLTLKMNPFAQWTNHSDWRVSLDRLRKASLAPYVGVISKQPKETVPSVPSSYFVWQGTNDLCSNAVFVIKNVSRILTNRQVFLYLFYETNAIAWTSFNLPLVRFSKKFRPQFVFHFKNSSLVTMRTLLFPSLPQTRERRTTSVAQNCGSCAWKTWTSSVRVSIYHWST